MFHDLQRNAGGINRFLHNREPAAIDKRTVIRLNRDTLYSFAVVDVTGGARLTLPEHGDRYLSAMVLNQDHCIGAIFRDPGDHELTADALGTPYIGVDPRLPVGQYELTFADVPVDGFWSISVYNANGFFDPNERGAYTVNNITGVPNADGSITIRFGDYPSEVPDAIPITQRWNYLVRLYRPRPEITEGRWEFPTITT